MVSNAPTTAPFSKARTAGMMQVNKGCLPRGGVSQYAHACECAPIRRASSLRRAQNPTEALGEGLHRGKRARARAACKRGKRLTRFIYSMTKK